MKRSNLAFKAIAAVFFLAVLAYVGVYLYRSLDNPFRTVIAQTYTIYDSISTNGILVREELLLYTDYEIVYISVDEAKKIASGGEVAVAYSSQENLDRAMELRLVQAQIEHLEQLRDGGVSSEDPLQQNIRMKENILKLRQAANSRDMSALEDTTINLQSLIFIDQEHGEAQQTLEALYAEQNELSAGPDGDAVSICAPQAGLFTSFIDGYESLTPEDVCSMSSDELSALLRDARSAPDRALGKLVCGITWYYAVNLKAEDAKGLEEGETAELILGSYSGAPLEMTVEGISTESDGTVAVVFSCDHSMAETINIRIQTAELLKNDYSGIKVPKNAIRLNDDGAACVYVVNGLQAQEKTVDIIYDAGDFYIVKNETDRMEALRAGDSLIVSAKGLYDGKVLS
jgi:hypothetical protein